MNKNWGLLAIVIGALSACQDSNKSDSKQTDGFSLNAIAGIYQDTLPELNALGNIVQLTLNSDSTYSMVERTFALDQKIIVPRNTAGKIEIELNGEKLKLVPRNAGAKVWWLSNKQGSIMVLDSLGNVHSNSSSYGLQRISSAVAAIGHDQLFSVDKGTVRYPLNVYSRPGGSNIAIASFYLSTCSEAELGLTYGYVSSFKGKLENIDPMALALKKESKNLSEIRNRVVVGNDGTSVAFADQAHVLTSLVMTKTPENWTVTYTYLDANDENWMGKDVYTAEGSQFKLMAKGVVNKF